jgi:hydroxylaminobenzene mutase
MSAHRALLRAGFALVLLALVSGALIFFFPNPRMGASAHVTGVLNGLLLVALALSWEALRLPPRRGALVRGLFLYGTYANWAGTLLAAVWGTNRLTPVAGAGFGATGWKELVVGTILISLSLAMLAGMTLVVHALRPQRAAAGAAAAAGA